ncbi:MAG: bifunctional diaminohydroxyphosphoribosylaminopyrimidine deaminase/5-amino-6-(5-phosphoribosylamino)uracil reductase RibD [Syntrophomonas sp.]|uniref:bifunctional diaminohydroxyphosphoribosylaminopyrimidine deaminase/5-amino-6-(5-phosphoribosylamino)uracil reductase RibD n=1 Tax=Syntrophomonas sp. TaxID=2053627 RepID=UPI002607FCED|nr:bifunctional diaminohydroxyphosphoribosylaminopyrimidine deaminase/5-amino-6-(5-phosphoribosylamino)uracil reductase RibD [Syntrophomonas sp.]MDD2509736.1 bifunctional diaminohydroxyphosphoribosylaminopyrimidine deaminase/5-amino-6-(5-phosphoribosylamino)uracil reductase RibD [Syntrophomonas sp.]MDD3879072.1 bifunctional diaminohydroxyphosphoribosylaminopyrimidine deaminase/5-amino-6-(5-phosphoribosylamino)uracil reductase RibD [Syntrophomonas sp.]MDD4625868.1 bifunctional diaminohydroxyphosp
MTNNDDQRFMQRALELAARARGRTSPNPLVGAVLVKDGQIQGEGYHQKAGSPHAEIHALNAAGPERAKGASIYVSLEPCSHYGRTPPCALALVEAGIAEVVMATLDPNPQVSGRGLHILREAGIKTRVGVLADEARKLNEFFFKYIQSGRPFVSLKLAMTLDGKIATSTGDSRWITGAASREYVHHLRNTYDGIMLGIGTVLKDDPRLNTRLELEGKRDPVRIIIDGRLELPLNSVIALTSHQQRTIIFAAEDSDQEKAKALRDCGLEIIKVGGKADCLDLKEVLDILGKMEILSLLLEGGAEINSNMIENKLVDKLYWFIAPKIIGGRSAPSPLGGEGIKTMNQALKLNSIETRYFEEDILISAYL